MKFPCGISSLYGENTPSQRLVPVGAGAFRSGLAADTGAGALGGAALVAAGITLAGASVAFLLGVVGSVISGFFEEQADKPTARTKRSTQDSFGKRWQVKSDICMSGFDSGVEFNWARLPKRYMIKQIMRF